MTPLEIAAKARWESRAEDNFPHRWEDFSDEGRKAHMEDMRAALLALARADLPDDVFTRAFGELTSDNFDRIGHGEAEAVFRAMCRAIAESGK